MNGLVVKIMRREGLEINGVRMLAQSRLELRFLEPCDITIYERSGRVKKKWRKDGKEVTNG